MLRLVFGIIFFASQAFALKYSDCGSKTGRIIDLRISGCEESDVCELKSGETYTYGITFESLTDSEDLKTHVSAIMGGVTYPVPLPNSSTCETEDIECPIENGKTYDFENTVTIARNAPSMELQVKWELKDDNKQNVICGLFPVKIVQNS